MKTIVYFAFALSLLLTAHGAPSLKKVGEIGRVVDSQGITSLRPTAGNRWTCASPSLPVKPGDWLRTDIRGANALHVKLAGGSELILGPGTMIEVVAPTEIKLLRGEVEVSPGKGREITVSPGNGKAFVVGEAAVLRRIEGERGLQVLEKEPNWLKGFKGTVVRESMGQLVAKVDGRDTPLTIGFHKVSVDIRDQIARTTIEESFVNHTKSNLEGVFYFPLPQDASISNFGMWINGELVEADVVEKQRAREIYETILREKRDPGLLEWTGGNLFKARVFPIFGNSEKRIKITYTQVLPYRNGSYRYSYALQSEMLRLNPLRELAVNVRLHSALPIVEFKCPTHSARVNTTAHSAQAEFSAAQYTPNSDFEIEIAVDHKASPVTIIPHRRGEDGYFLALITPPDEAAAWQRDLVADGEPLELIVLADTSGSMDDTARSKQDALLAALLGSLGEKDNFRLATCDVATRWFSPEQFDGSREDYVGLARDFVAARNSLGWSDLDAGFASVMEVIGGRPNTHVVYIGDGVITTGDADPVAFAKRLRRLYGENSATFHAIAPSSSFESGVLNSIASLGGGSVRGIAGSDTPSVVANQLLAEISAPGLRDLKIEFEGLRTARVYPERLPNLAAGRQQIVLGRYLPGGDKTGEVVVTGVRGGETVTYRAPVLLRDAVSGNSFIPRLWSRMHLDALLAQGRTPEIRNEVIALSEEYHIMTPYTSFLVLESDADRERFKVKRRFLMRDGERFFAEGRDNANYELLQKQMRLAGSWRLNLRRAYINELRRIGRGSGSYRTANPYMDLGGSSAPFYEGYHRNGFMRKGRESSRGLSWNRINAMKQNTAVDGFSGIKDIMPLDLPGIPSPVIEETWASEAEEDLKLDFEMPMENKEILSLALEDRDAQYGDFERSKRRADFGYRMGGESAAGAPAPSMPGAPGRQMLAVNGKLGDMRYMVGYDSDRLNVAGGGQFAAGLRNQGWHWTHYMQDLNSLFPTFSSSVSPRGKRGDHTWPQEAIDLADSLLRFDALTGLGASGVELRLKHAHRNQRLKKLIPSSEGHSLFGGKAWMNASESPLTDRHINWLQGDTRGVLRSGLGLGRLRAATENETRGYPAIIDDGSFTSLADRYRGNRAELREAGEGQILLLVTPVDETNKSEQRFLIDTKRKVLVRHENFHEGKRVTTREFSDWVKAGGSWWPTLVRHKDADGNTTAESKLKVRALDGDAFAIALTKALADRDDVLFLHEPQPDTEKAKQAALDGKRSFESELALLRHFAQSQQWERANENFEKMRGFARGKPGFRWLEMRYLAMKRRNEEAKQSILAAASDLAGSKGAGRYMLATHLRTEASRVMANTEQHQLLESLKPIYLQMPQHSPATKEWQQAWMWSLRNIGRHAEALEIAKANAERYSWDAGSQTQYANLLSDAGDRPGAQKWLKKMIAAKHWTRTERDGFRGAYLNNLDAENRIDQAYAFLDTWLKQEELPAAWVFQRHAVALVQLDQVERAHKMIEKWLRTAAIDGDVELSDEVRIHLEAALNFLFNNAYRHHSQTLDERFHKLLAKVVRKFALDPKQHNFAMRIMGDHRFHLTDQVRKLRAEYTKLLRKRSGDLPFADLQRLVAWIMANDPAVELEIWKSIVEPIIERWSEMESVDERDSWASVIGNILSSRVGGDSYTDFLRRQLRESPEGQEGRYASVLFNHLTTLVWSEEIEAEAFELLYRIAPQGGVREIERGGSDLAFRASMLLHLNNWVQNNGYAVLYAAVERKEELSRTELAAAQRDKRLEIREHLAARLVGELENRADLEEGFAHWLNIERLYFDIVLKRDPAEAAAECWEFLGKFDPLAEDENRTLNEAVLIARYLDTLEYLAASPTADAKLTERVLALHKEGLESESEAWRSRNYRLLVALDRPAELKRALRSWIRPENADTHWRVTLGYLLAELNDIDGAIAEFEIVEKADELRPAEYKALADWYLVRDKREQRERALLGFYNTMPDHQLSNLISQRTAQIRQGFETGVPEDLDPEVASMFVALLRKSANPNNYVGQLAELYRYTKDFRILETLPEGIIGHSAIQIYPYLQTMATVHQHIRDEATADLIFENLEKVRDRAETKTDARGLDLLEMLVRRKASEVLNQPGQHLPMALAAMKRAFAIEWDDGERVLMAQFLYHLGQITQESLAAEQLREFNILHRDEETDNERTTIGHLYAQLLWRYGRHDDAIATLETVLRDAEDYSGGNLPRDAQNPLSTYLGYLVQRKHYARAEKEIFRIQDQSLVSDMRRWLVVRKYQLYGEALSGKGEVSIGKGLTLYKNAERLIIGEMRTADNSLRNQLVSTLTRHYYTANSVKVGDAPADIKKFAYDTFDELVPFETQSYQSLLTTVSESLRHLISYREGLAFLVTHYEIEPASFRAQRDGAWRRYGSTMASYRHHNKEPLGDLEPRLLKIVLVELRRELETRERIFNSIYWNPQNSYFWNEKKAHFAKVAEEVLKERYKSDQSVVYIVQYLHGGLRLHERAIEVLIGMYEEGRLDESTWALLVSYLESAGRWGEVVQYLAPLVKFRPDNLHYRLRLMRAYHHIGKKNELIATLDAIDKRWHDKNLWNESTMQSIAITCHQTQLWSRAVEYYEELIPLHQRSRPARGIGNGTLSNYYTTLADCHLHLDNTPAAVEAASGAIVSWGSHISNRNNALQTLRKVLRESKDLEGYVQLFEDEVEETGLENPILRKALGQVYLDKPDGVDRAIYHLALAVESQPDDEQTYHSLIKAYDKKGDAVGAIARVLEAAKLNRRNIAFFKDLASRYEKQERPIEAERARTNIVEALPNESEGHAMLAEIRQGQDRWEDAAAHWQQVAIIRELEPTGLQRLAEAQIKLGKNAAATASLQKLLVKDWPSRFGNVHSEARNKLAAIDRNAG